MAIKLDEIEYLPEEISQFINKPQKIGRRGIYTVPELSEICQCEKSVL